MAWLVAGVSSLSLLLHLGLIYLAFGDLSKDMANNLAGRVNLTYALLQGTQPAKRDETAKSLSQALFSVYRLEKSAMDSPDALGLSGPGSDHMLELLRNAVQPDIFVHLSPFTIWQNTGIVFFELAIEGERWGIRYEAHPPVAAILGTGLGWLLFIGTVVLFSLIFGLRSITRPMTQLTSILAKQNRNLQPLPIPPKSSFEIQTLVTAFNKLASEVERADQIKNQLLAGVSHDLRTPLARIRLRVETECDGLVADELTADLFAVERIVSQFMAFVQGENNAGLGKPEFVLDLVSWVVSSYASSGYQVELVSSDLQVKSPHFFLPDLAVQRALTNLIDNALSHGQTPVLVALTCTSRNERQFGVLTVWDHGRGMSEAEFMQAQLPFVRLSESRSSSGHCGLGLAIVAQLSRQLGGQLERSLAADGRFGISIVWPLVDIHQN